MTRRPGPPKPAPPAPALARRAPQHRPLPRYPHAGHPDRLYGEELAPATRHAFARTIADEGHDPADYLYLPVHPWQWDETIAPLFAPQLADRSIIALPTDNDLRLPQQSIRTFLNLSRPRARTVKLPLSILNTLVWRGLPTERTLAAPAVTRWVHGLRDADPYLRDETRVILLGETASVTVEHPSTTGCPASRTSSRSCSAVSGASRSANSWTPASAPVPWPRCYRPIRRAAP